MAAGVAAAGAGQAQPVQTVGLHLQHKHALSAWKDTFLRQPKSSCRRSTQRRSAVLSAQDYHVKKPYATCLLVPWHCGSKATNSNWQPQGGSASWQAAS